MKTIALKSGCEVPSVGLGLWKIDPSETAQVVCSAIECGYRHFDAASDYGNEAEAGDGFHKAIADGSIRREDLWITSKLWNTYHRPEHVRPALERSLSDLKLDYLDLYLMHFPIALAFVPFEERYPPGWLADPNSQAAKMQPDRVPLIDTWQAMVDLVGAGLVREIGVCNFGVSLLRDLMNASATPPAMLQVELHPYLTQDKLVRFCRESEIAVTGFSPLGAQSYFSLNMADAEEAVIEQPAIREIALRHHRSAAQIVLRWGVQRGTAIVPKTTKIDRLKENLSLFDFELSGEEMSVIDRLNQNRRFNDPGDFGEAAFHTFFPIYE
ncbi:aldo/keto reductase [Novipirellula artificiosorum]|uniref:Putative oxidoreductase YtbE n=1 Tax=Novipirellula artificiosorum TaxID=2528016 RepID=A0A5C6DW62_9BACT|nr:aldo/keto reductase [Novipirellula artificiosorum]TWU40832.1 putative oxidoreductase YtbE [Novipirellula artificiosorum]